MDNIKNLPQSLIDATKDTMSQIKKDNPKEIVPSPMPGFGHLISKEFPSDELLTEKEKEDAKGKSTKTNGEEDEEEDTEDGEDDKEDMGGKEIVKKVVAPRDVDEEEDDGKDGDKEGDEEGNGDVDKIKKAIEPMKQKASSKDVIKLSKKREKINIEPTLNEPTVSGDRGGG